MFEAIGETSLIVCANQRQSRFLHSQWQLWQLEQGRSVFANLQCLSLTQWYDVLWRRLGVVGALTPNQGSLLNDDQAKYIWQSVITAHMQDHPLLAADSCVEPARNAWNDLRLWCKSGDDLRVQGEAAQPLLDWIANYQEICRTNGYIDHCDRIELIRSLIGLYSIDLPEMITLYGFDNVSPLEQKLFDSLAEKNISINPFNVVVESHCAQIVLSDQHDEILNSAKWAAAKVQDAQAAGHTPPSIAIVLPNLAALRAEVETIFNAVFEPQAIQFDAPRAAPPYTVSAGEPLAQTPIYRAAFALLGCLDYKIEIEDLNKLFASPFLFSSAARADALQFVEQLKLDYNKLTMPVLLQEAQRFASRSAEHSAAWFKPFKSVLEACVQLRASKLSFSDWAVQFTQLLTSSGWPGDRTLDSFEFQQMQHWPALIERLQGLDQVESAAVPWRSALNEFVRLAYIPFHPQTEVSPVQVLGVLEAAGLQFDYIWVAGLDYRNWPAAAQPNPFIPVALQKQWDMPRSSAERERILAQQLTTRFAVSASQVILSYPEYEGDQPLQPSPLITDYDKITAEKLRLWQQASHVELNRFDRMDVREDGYGEALASGSSSGGTGILKDQALCPFRAYAKHRLQAVNQEPYQSGVTALLRGIFIHQILEWFWREISHWEKLVSLSETELYDRVSEIVDKAWRAVAQDKQLGQVIATIEKQRAIELVLRWLEIEKTREPFQVLYQEKTVQLSLAGLVINMRLDRCDQLSDCEQTILIDYKTGRTDIKSWFGARPDDPQLPLYAIVEKNSVAAIAFAELNRYRVELNGIQQDGGELHRLQPCDELEKWQVPSSWQTLITQWQAILESLAQAYQQAYAAVDPKKGPTSCAYCDLQSLCRIAERVDDTTDD